MEFSLSQLWESMGFFARLILILLILMSVLSLVIMFERAFAFMRTKQESLSFAGKVAPILERGDLEGAYALAKGNEKIGYLGRLIRGGLGAYHAKKHEAEDLCFESTARALERQSQRESHTLRRGLTTLASVSSLAPFVGLLGTVVGIVNSFTSMAETGAGGLGTVSAGVAEALVATATGLFVAIPALAVYNYMQGWVDARGVDMAETANELLDIVASDLKVRHADARHATAEEAVVGRVPAVPQPT
ncbi:MAG: MotA/TolQ/ExbB proton channel family protein [Deltaproteobacteria bacterium]|nr:MotA/TolQ/ExbB proton channel family protein [Deltaproteobacteria bacterium]